MYWKQKPAKLSFLERFLLRTARQHFRTLCPKRARTQSRQSMNVVVLPREHIAGRDGACFRWTTPRPVPTRTIDASFEGCFTQDGVMLRAMTDLGNVQTEHRAQNIRDVVADADLALPYPMKPGPPQMRNGDGSYPPSTAPTPKH